MFHRNLQWNKPIDKVFRTEQYKYTINNFAKAPALIRSVICVSRGTKFTLLIDQLLVRDKTNKMGLKWVFPWFTVPLWPAGWYIHIRCVCVQVFGFIRTGHADALFVYWWTSRHALIMCQGSTRHAPITLLAFCLLRFHPCLMFSSCILIDHNRKRHVFNFRK